MGSGRWLEHGVHGRRRSLAFLVAVLATLWIPPSSVHAATLKAIQSGTTTIPAATASTSVILATAVDTTRSFLVFGVAEAEDQPQTGQVVGRLSSATTVDFIRNTAAGSAITVKWYVAEFTTGVAVQRGTTVVPNDTPLNVTIAAVNTSRAFPIVTVLSGGTGYDRNDFIRAKITGATTLQLNHGDTGSSATADWQVVEYQGANVQTGDLTFNPADLSLTGTPTAVNPARSWLLFSDECHASPVQPSCGTATNIGPRLFRGVVTNGTTLTFDRSVAGAVGPPAEVYQLTWYLVEFTDGTTVQSGSEPFGAAETLRNVPLATPAPTGASLAAASAFMRGGRSPYTLDDVPGVGWFTLDLTSSSNLRLTRGSTNAPGPVPAASADVGWYVVTFNCNCQVLSTAETATTVTVTASGSFQMTWDTAFGGGIHTFYDLAEDPSRTYDLAGNDGSGVKLLHHFGFLSGGTFYDPDDGTSNTGSARWIGSPPKLDLLEVTATRMRVRQEAFFQQSGGNAVLPLKGYGDYTVHPAGRVALHWNRRGTASLPFTDEDLAMGVITECPASGASCTDLSAYSQSGVLPGPPGNAAGDDFVLAVREQVGRRTDFLNILSADWALANRTEYDQTVAFLTWRDTPTVSPLPVGDSETWNFLTYFKPTNLVNNADPAVTSRSSDYRGPSSLSVLVGGPWQMASENTGGGDDFNEAEGTYVATVDPTNGLTFRIDGSAAVPRYHPMFKLRQWRSLAGPPSVTLQGTPLVAGVDYRADVKPISRAHFAQNLLWHSTLENAAALNPTPDVGNGGSSLGVTYVAGRYGSGAQVPAGTNYLSFPTTDFDPAKGALEFWYQPDYNSNDATEHNLAGFRTNGTNEWFLRKDTANNLVFTITAAGATSTYTVAAGNFSWRASDWVHLRIEWDDTVSCSPCTGQQRILFNGVEPPHTDPTVDYNSASLPLQPDFRVGGFRNGANNATGIYDEVYVYGGSSATPTPIARGGLVPSGSEYLADSGKNFTLGFTGINATTRSGQYFYLGADSQFRGLNVGLATRGAGVAAGDLDWEYWNGAAWTTLESVAGFTDTTSSFTRTGNVFWQDPPAWAPYSVNGGPDLYYVRVHLKAGSTYTTSPVEGLIKTDILLFQYCGDITAAAQQFVFAAPVPTEVTLQSFEASAANGAVDLGWTTASELDNLGFHLYRSLSPAGPFERITSSVIPGLGSSAVGTSYRYRDPGLTNGVPYFYELEDIDTSGKATLHGPVSATPSHEATDGDGGTPPPGGNGGSDPPSGPGNPGTAYGDPSATSLKVLERDSRHVLVELRTGGFYATEGGDGSVEVSIPGFDDRSRPGDPSLPTRHTWVEATAGRKVLVTSVQASDLVSYPGLRPAPAATPAMEVSHNGIVRPARSPRHESSAFHRGVFPRMAARVLGTGFQEETKKAELELAPLRFNALSGRLLLFRRLLVRLDFAGVESREVSLGGSRGRRPTEPRPLQNVAAQLVVHQKGLYRLAFSDLFGPAHIAIPVAGLRLTHQGQPVAFHVDRASFGPGSSLYFFADGVSLESTPEAVYELTRKTGGVRMAVGSAAPSGPAAEHYLQKLDLEQNKTYQSGLLDAPDLWLWDVLVSPVTRTYPFSVDRLANTSESAHLTVWLQGASDFDVTPDHHLRVSVNGTVVGEASWDGKKPQTIEADVTPGVLVEGENELEIENVGDTPAAYSMVLLDRFSVSYPRLTTAVNGVLEGRFTESGTVEVSGLGTDSVLLDTTAATPRWLTGASLGESGLRFRAETGHSYEVVSSSALLRPEVRRPLASDLKNLRNRADYLLVGPREFLSVAQPLLDLRESQGLRTRGVAIEDVYDQFGFGEASPDALKAFLSFAYHHWQKPSPRYVLLLGDATYDPRNYLKTGVVNRVPPVMVKTSYLWTASDPAYAAVNGDDSLPDLALGRLPAQTSAEAKVMIDKIVAFETQGRDFTGSVVLVADNADIAGDFEADADDVASSLFSDRTVEKVYLRDLGAGTRTTIQNAFDNGPSIVNYIGHGGIAVWASENIWNNLDVASLAPQPQPPLLFTMNCLNGYFHFPNLNSLAEQFLKAEGKGAIAAFAPSGLSVDAPAHAYHKLVLQEITSGHHDRLGDAVLAAQNAYATTGDFPELLSIYHLFGDPALRIR